MAEGPSARDTSIRTYRARRDFHATPEPPPAEQPRDGAAPIFVVQKHHAHRAGLHWDFRLEHGGVLWSWAVRKGPSLDPTQRRVAVHVEDHPLDYADFQGRIPDGEYGAGTVETWDRGTWQPLEDADEGMRKGELKFVLAGQRLRGRFTLVRMKGRPRERQEAWLLIKGHDEEERAGVDAEALEAERPLVPAEPAAKPAPAGPPAAGAKQGALPKTQAPQLASIAEEPPEGEGWLSEIKFDGYRLLIWLSNGKARVVTRNGLDWTDRLPAVAAAARRLAVESALLDGELVAVQPDGTSSFHELQAALSEGRDRALHVFVFDLLHLNGWDLRPCKLTDRKRVLAGLADWKGMFRYSDHIAGDAAPVRRQACRMKLEGILCKRADAPYRAGRSRDWLKLKCAGREEFVVLGWTPPGGSRTGLGSLHVGYYDGEGRLHYAGGVGTGFSEQELDALRRRLDALAVDAPAEILVAGDPLERDIRWVRPDLVIEVQYTGWSGAGRVRHAVFLGLREDKSAKEVVRDVADPAAERTAIRPPQPADGAPRTRRRKAAVPPLPPPAPAPPSGRSGKIVVAKAPKQKGVVVDGVALTHPDRELWPGITKQDLAAYWERVAPQALPGLARRPLAIVRCPEGIAGEHFFQKSGHGHLAAQIREGQGDGSPYLAIDDLAGLIALAQISAIELHAWGATEADPTHPDRLVFDLDPGEGVAFADVVRAALEVRDRLQRHGLASFCRTTGGKGLHVVVPLAPRASWDEVKPWCRALAEAMSQEQPDKYLPTVSKAQRRGKILIDWLRNGRGATAVASYCPRARPGATVATPLAWSEVTPRLDPTKFTLTSVPERIARLREPPWPGFEALAQVLPDLAAPAAAETKPAARRSRIVQPRAPRRPAP
jgi:bifunctional non-homologous end joining protein LigD